MNKSEIAKELVAVARELTAETKNLDDIIDVMPAMKEKLAEYERKREELQQEMNKMYGDAVREVKTKVGELSQAIGDALVDYFEKNGMGVRKADIGDSLVEIFIGDDDGVDRYQSKVSTHIRTTGDLKATYMLRNDNLDDHQNYLSPKNTIRKLLDRVKKAHKDGFWDEGRI